MSRSRATLLGKLLVSLASRVPLAQFHIGQFEHDRLRCGRWAAVVTLGTRRHSSNMRIELNRSGHRGASGIQRLKQLHRRIRRDLPTSVPCVGNWASCPHISSVQRGCGDPSAHRNLHPTQPGIPQPNDQRVPLTLARQLGPSSVDSSTVEPVTHHGPGHVMPVSKSRVPSRQPGIP